jgi:hypothetical protein
VNRYAFSIGLDDAPFQDGDGGFIGVNERLAPELLPAGWVSAAENCEAYAGELRMPRRGLVSPQFAQIRQTLFGAGVFRDPNGVEAIVLVGESTAWLCREGNPPEAVTLPGTLEDGVSVRQAFDRLFVFRDGGATWEYTGIGSFAEVDRSLTGDGTRPLPMVATAELLNDRLYAPEDDYVYASDIADYTRYALGNRARFNAGKDDTIVRVFPFTQNTLLVFKGKSVLALTGATGDLSGTRVEIVNPELGCIAAESVASVGADALFLSSSGVYRVQQIVESRLGTVATAVSHSIPGAMRRIHWQAAAGAQAAVIGDYYYLAVPIDRSERNNAILAYNLVTDAWEGVHTFTIQIDRLLIATWRGERRLFAVDFESGRAHLLYEGGDEDCFAPENFGTIGASTTPAAGTTQWALTLEDYVDAPAVGDHVFDAEGRMGTLTLVTGPVTGVYQVRTLDASGFEPEEGELILRTRAAEPIEATVTTRGYRAENAGRKRFRLVQVDVQSRHASWGVELLTDGNAEAAALAPATVARSRTRNLDGSAWDSTNTGDDHGAAGREDYAVALPMKLGTGAVLDREQSYSDRFLCSSRGRVGQARIRLTRGTLGIRAVRIEGTQIDRNFATQT